MYGAGLLGHFLPISGRGFFVSYYLYSSILVVIPTFLLISDVLKIADMMNTDEKYSRSIKFLIATPSFVFMLLLNWYIIGVFFAVRSIRKIIESSKNDAQTPRNVAWSGALFGLSAMANLVTAAPALGVLIFGTRTVKERVWFLSGIAAAVTALYLPLIVLNSFPHSYLNAQHTVVQFGFVFPNLNVITDFLRYEQNWYIEGSWMLALFSSTDPIRHYIFPALFATLSLAIFLRYRTFLKSDLTEAGRTYLTILTSALFTFALLFSSYVSTPQMNLLLLPFFVLIPLISSSYIEFLAFDTVNALVIVWGFSAPLAFLGINIPTPVQFGSIWQSPIQLLAVIRSLWIGKFLIYNGLISRRNSAVIRRFIHTDRVLVENA